MSIHGCPDPRECGLRIRRNINNIINWFRWCWKRPRASRVEGTEYRCLSFPVDLRKLDAEQQQSSSSRKDTVLTFWDSPFHCFGRIQLDAPHILLQCPPPPITRPHSFRWLSGTLVLHSILLSKHLPNQHTNPTLFSKSFSNIRAHYQSPTGKSI